MRLREGARNKSIILDVRTTKKGENKRNKIRKKGVKEVERIVKFCSSECLKTSPNKNNQRRKMQFKRMKDCKEKKKVPLRGEEEKPK